MTENNKNKMLARIINVLNFDWKTKPELINSITQTETVEIFDEAGQPIQKEVTFFISTETMEKFCKIIRKKAGIPDVYSNEQ